MATWAEPPAAAIATRASAGPRVGGSLALRLATFLPATALAGFAYATLLHHPPAGRALAVAAIATAYAAAAWLAGAAGPLARAVPGRPRYGRRGARLAIIVLASVLALALGLLAIGVPAHLLRPSHWSALVHGLERGAGGITDRNWPYLGGSHWVRTSVLALLIPATMAMALLCFWPAPARAGASRFIALAIAIALALCGLANAPAGAWRVQGLVLALLVFAWLWLPTLRRLDVGRALGWTLACAVPALLLAPLLSVSRAWIPFADGGRARVTSFQWDQLYGPVAWSRSQQAMLSVRANSPPGLLHVTSLDRFDGLRFIRTDSPPATTARDIPARGAEPSWFEHARITVDGLRSNLLAGGAGLTTEISDESGLASIVRRAPDGTLSVPETPVAGVSYSIVSYAPRPTAQQLRGAPRSLPRAYLPYTEFELPASAASALHAPRLVREAAAAPRPAQLVRVAGAGVSASAHGAALRRILASPYSPMYELARRLAAGQRTSYGVVESLQRYLLSHYTYDEHPPLRRYPLEAFLFRDRRGYCEQFSGAMTLMLRMDGLPARVGVGFKPAVLDPLASAWTVSALDAHAWVEVFFSGIGWVSFDPTPPTPTAHSTAATGRTSKAALLEDGASSASANSGARAHATHAKTPGARSGDLALAPWALALALLAVSLCGAALLARRRRARTRIAASERAIRELDGALAAMSFTTSSGMTLTQLAERFERAAQTGAAAYVVLLRELRFGRPRALSPAERASARANRLALRRALARGRGLRGRVRALLLIPPRAPRL